MSIVSLDEASYTTSPGPHTESPESPISATPCSRMQLSDYKRRSWSRSRCKLCSAIGRVVSTSRNADPRLGLGLVRLAGDAGVSATGAVASAGGARVGVKRLDLGLLPLKT